ncbi:hypothetical protein [Bradyrhizobium liaoningense]
MEQVRTCSERCKRALRASKKATSGAAAESI